MAEILLVNYERCLQGCPKRNGASNVLTRDHVFPNQVGRDHPIILPVVNNQKNLVRVCWGHHVRIDVEKFECYRRGGLTDLVIYVAERYPNAQRREAETLRLEHFSGLFLGCAAVLGSLNGDTPRQHRLDYREAGKLAEDYGQQFEERFEARGGFKSLGSWLSR